MPVQLEIALRYLRSARADALISLLSRITAVGLAVGVATLILALAALTGFQDRLLGDILSRTPDLQVLIPETAEGNIEALLDDESRIVDSQTILRGRGWLRRGGDLLPVEIVGFERVLPPWMPIAVEGAVADGVWLSAQRAVSWGVLTGDIVEIVSPRMTLTPRGPAPRSLRLEVAGLHDGGRAEVAFSDRIALPSRQASKLLGQSDRRLDITLRDRGDVDDVARGLRERIEGRADLPGVEVLTWRDQNRALLFVLRLEKMAIFLAVALIVIVASFALMASLSLILSAKQREIGVLGALGMRRRGLQSTFVWLGGLLAVTGTVVGTVAGVSAAWALDTFAVVKLPSDVYIVDHVPFLVRPRDVVVIILSAVLTTLVASLLGSRAALARTPIESLRK